MARKFHVSADGNPHPCFASIRPCPLGGPDSHYDSLDDARGAYEESMKHRTFLPDGKQGYTITALMTIDEPRSAQSSGPMRQIAIKTGFPTAAEAIAWARENISDATERINVVNEDYDGPRLNDKGQVMSPDKDHFKVLNLVDISKERALLESGDAPAIGRYYLDNYGDQIKDVHTMRLFTTKAASVLSEENLGRLRGYLKAATYGKK